MLDMTGREIAGYEFGPYWFGVTHRGKGNRISGLCGVSYHDEAHLLADYDNVQPGFPLIRVYQDGERFTLRPGTTE